MKRYFLAFFVLVMQFSNIIYSEQSGKSLSFKDLTSQNSSDSSEQSTEGKLYIEANEAELMIQPGYIPGSNVHVEIVSIENETDHSEFKVFYGAGLSRGIIFPHTTFTFDKALGMVQNNATVQLLCSKGSYLSIFLQDEGRASGKADDGYDGPYYLSMWLKYPQVNEQEKVSVRYQVAAGRVGKIGLKIGSKGECQVVALQDVKLL